jgi:hypothetical protein
VWLHNLTGDPVAGIRLRLTRLTAHDGTEVDGSAATFEPAEIVVPAQASAHTRLQLLVPAGTATGVYHGHVLAAGLLDTALPARLVVPP